MPTEQILARVRRALLLDTTAFEEVRDDAAFTPFAIGLAAAAVLLGGIGTWLWAVFQDAGDKGDFFIEGTILGTIFLVLLWLAGVAVTYVILTQVYREDISPDALVRVVTLGHVPFAASLLVFIPGIGFGFGILAIAAMFFYTIFGLRAAYPALDPFRAMVAVLAGFAVWAMILPILSSDDNIFAPGTFLFEWTEDITETIVEVPAVDLDFDIGDLGE